MIVAIAGVMCRGAAGGRHPGWALLLKNLIMPLRRMGRPVHVCGFNNIPDTIDGDTAPADGGRSFFTLQHYEEHRQGDIDASRQCKRYVELVESKNTSHPPNSRANIARVLFVEGCAIRYIANGIEGGRFRPDDQVVLVTPDLCLFGGSVCSAVDPRTPKGTLSALGTLRHGEAPTWTENGFIAGRADDLIGWRRDMLAPDSHVRLGGARAGWDGRLNYELWWTASMLGYHVRTIRLAAGPETRDEWWDMHNLGRVFRGYRGAGEREEFPWRNGGHDLGWIHVPDGPAKPTDGSWTSWRARRQREVNELRQACASAADAA